MNYLKRAGGLVLALVLVACGGGGGSSGSSSAGGGGATTGSPTLSLALFDQGGSATASVGSSGIVSAKATLKGGDGGVLSGVKVSFVSDSQLVKISPSDALTDASGVATVQVSAASMQASGAGTLSVSAVVSGTTVTASKDYQLAPLQLTLVNLDVGATSLAAYGNRPVSVTAQINGAPATATPVQVAFSASCGTVTPQNAVTDASGRASTTYKADASACSGSNVRITASADGAIPLTGTIAVDAPKATNMQFVSATPSLIYLTGSVGPTQSQVAFKVVDVSGNAVGNHAVQMSLVNAAPGVSLGSVGNISPMTVTSDADGKVSVPVFSGTVPTSVQVRATSVANSGVRADSNVLTVATGIPVQRAMSVALSKFSIEGLNVDGSTADVTVSLADRVGNPVPDGTQVNFVSSSGVMIPPVCVVSGGTSSCKSQIRSQGTRPADGRVAVMAYVPGEEDFIDANGNNVFDNGESYTDMGNAHMDANFNGSYDTGEFTVPRAGTFACAAGLNGRPNTCDAQWGAIDVRRQAMVVFASSLPIFSNPATVTRSFQYLGKTVTEVISVSIDVADTNGNSLATETSVKGSAASGVHTDVPSVVCQFAFEGDLTGTRTALIANRVGPTRITFNLTGCYVGIGDRIGFSTTSPTGVVSAPFNVSF